MKTTKLETISIKNSSELSEKWVQDLIAADPTILGLGELTLRDRERIHRGAGRLDLLLQEPESLKRYEVELQLGATDESHIIRTIEYWDLERRRYPQYEHVAVIIAEDVTTRFLNIIQLFNGTIPLIALKMTAYKVGDGYALTFVKVVDEMNRGLVDNDEPVAVPSDRSSWETKASKKSLVLMDSLHALAKKVEPKALLKYNKHYVGLEVGGNAMNFTDFMPRKDRVILGLKLQQTDEVDQRLADVELEQLKYDAQFGRYRIRVAGDLTPAQAEAIEALMREAHANY